MEKLLTKICQELPNGKEWVRLVQAFMKMPMGWVLCRIQILLTTWAVCEVSTRAALR